MTDVFISYSSSDYSSAEYLLKTFESMYLTCWMAPRDIPTGRNYADVIPNAIRNAKVFVILVSQHSQNSDQVRNELNLATTYKRIMLPVRLDDAPLHNDFHYHLSRRHWTEANGRLVAAASELTTFIHKQIAPDPDPTPERSHAHLLRVSPLVFILMVIGCAVLVIGTSSLLVTWKLLTAKSLMRIIAVTILVSVGLSLLTRTALFRKDNPFLRAFLKLLEKIRQL